MHQTNSEKGNLKWFILGTVLIVLISLYFASDKTVEVKYENSLEFKIK